MNKEIYKQKLQELNDDYKKDKNIMSQAEYHSLMYLYMNQYHKNNKKNLRKY